MICLFDCLSKAYNLAFLQKVVLKNERTVLNLVDNWQHNSLCFATPLLEDKLGSFVKP